MKHIQAGLIVGGMLTLGILVGAIFWAIVSTLVGADKATALVAIILVVTVLAIVVDIITEKRT